MFWLRGDAAFADPDLYEYCEAHRITYFIRLRGNQMLYDMIYPYLTRPVGRPPKSGAQVRILDFHYQAQSWNRPRRVVCKIEWHSGELFPRVGFIVSNSRLTAEEIIQVYNGRGEVENRIKEGKNTLRWDKTSCHSFDANHARLKMGVLAYNLLHLIREFYLVGEEVRRSIEWLIRRLIKVGAKVSYHARQWRVHITRLSRPERDPSDWLFTTGRCLVMVSPVLYFPGKFGVDMGFPERYSQITFGGDQGCCFCTSVGPVTCG